MEKQTEYRVEKMQAWVGTCYSEICLKIITSNNANQNKLYLYLMMTQLLYYLWRQLTFFYAVLSRRPIFILQIT
jgi:hypothetical protein